MTGATISAATLLDVPPKYSTLGAVRAQKVGRAEALERGRTLLDRFGLAGREDDRPDQLSGGQQQRVALARAFAGRPRALLLDEVTSALDPELVGEVLEVVRDLKDEGVTMIIATHEMSFARDSADRMMFIDEGVIAETAPTAEFFDAPRTPRLRAFLNRMIR